MSTPVTTVTLPDRGRWRLSEGAVVGLIQLVHRGRLPVAPWRKWRGNAAPVVAGLVADRLVVLGLARRVGPDLEPTPDGREVALALAHLRANRGRPLVPTCHPDRPHEAKGLCKRCYSSQRWAEAKERSGPNQRESAKAAQLQAILVDLRTNGPSTSYRVTARLGMPPGSSGSVARHLVELAAEGLVAETPGSRRSRVWRALP